MRNTTRWAAVAALLLIAPACGDDSSDDAGSTDTTAAAGDDACAASDGGEALTISDFAFDPGEISVASGEVVSVSNEDGTTHTFTSDEGGFDCSLPGGETANVLVDSAAGEYEFHCEIHSTMTGTLTVT